MLITALAVLLGLGASFARPWQQIELWLFDQFTVLSSDGKSVLPITIVGVDEASFTQIGQRWPWPRDLHARLVERLAAEGAAVIAFDMIFSEETTPQADGEFAQAIKRAHNVVLSADHAYRETVALRQWIRVDPLPEFLVAGAVTGLTSVAIDGDAVVRRFPDAEDIFWRRAISVLQRERPELGLAGQIPSGAMVRHLGPAHTFPYVSYYQVLAGGDAIPPGFFQDQIVLVGRDVRASPEVGSAQSDLFATPFLGRSQLLTPGVEIQATLIENALTGRALAPWPPPWIAAVLMLFAVLASPALWRWHPLWSGAWIGFLIGSALALSYWLFSERSQWLPIIATVTTLASMYVGMGLFSYLVERRRAARIKNTFSKFVAKQVVEQMIANPDLVRLGGERRELTLLFTDLKGFTTISEQNTPELVTQMINRHFTAMTEIIIRHEGTLVQFIGDAIMAFWGAPLDDAQHAYRAVTAAIDMQKRMAVMREEFAKEGLPPIYMRIGVHTGSVLVGNMGSEQHFGYTAVGDDVNLAARLEGINKFYGTGIMISGETVRRLSGRIAVRPVDRVVAKGKSQAIDIYTPSDDARLLALTEQAHASYRAGDWSAARAAWQGIARDYPEDTLAPVFLGRIAEFERNPPPAWNGSIALEKG